MKDRRQSVLKDICSKIFSTNNDTKYFKITFCGIKINIKKLYGLKRRVFELEKDKIYKSKFWDADWYLKTYNSSLYKADALEYWCSQGWKNNENPSKYFNTAYFQKTYNIFDRNPLLYYLEVMRYSCWYPDNKNNYKSDDDEYKIKEYLEYKPSRKAKGVLYTCILNDYDDLNEIKTYKYIDKDWDYVCFTENKTQLEQGQVGIWEIRPLVSADYDHTRINRWHKTHPHILFPEYEKSIYVDANINILTSHLFNVIQEKAQPIVLPEHFGHINIYNELNWALNSGIDDKNLIQKELDFIKSENMPQNYGFCENNLIYREHHNPKIIKLNEDWWYMIQNYSKRDQLSFCYILWKNGFKVEDITFKNARLDFDNFYIFDHKKGRT